MVQDVFFGRAASEKSAFKPKRTDSIRSQIAGLPRAAHNRLTDREKILPLATQERTLQRGDKHVWRFRSALERPPLLR